MPLILPGNVATATASTGYEVANSVRFNSADTAYMTKTLGTPTDADKYTFSFWVKRCKLGSQQSIFRSTNGNDDSHVTFRSDDTLEFQEYGGLSSIGEIQTTQKFRDVSAWYHIVLVYDSGNGTAGNRMRMYVNGTEVTSFGTDNNPSQDANSFFNKASAPLHFGRTNYGGGGDYFDGYVAEVVMCDGQAYAASDFGEFDEDSPTIWKPKDVSGLTFGTNGFYLDFEDSSNLGNDANGGTDFTETNLAAADQAVDSPTNNFATFNPLENYHAGGTFSEGNAKYTNPSGRHDFAVSTIGMTAGKWYYEVKVHQDTDYNTIGISDHSYQGSNQELSEDNYSYAYYNESGAGAVRAAASNILTSMPDFGDGDIIGVAVDLDNHKLYFSKNGSFINSGDPTSGSTGTGAVSIQDLSSVTSTYGQRVYFFAAGLWNTDSAAGNYSANFGGCSAFTVSSAASDGNSYGNFEYAPPSGYLALCTKNLGSDGG